MNTSVVHNIEASTNEDNRASRRDDSLANRDIALIRDVSVKVTATLGTAVLTVEKLFSLRNGDVVELDQQLDEAITFFMADKPIARGRLVAVGDNYGIELTEVL